MHDISAPGYCYERSKYYKANRSKQYNLPLNNAGFSSKASELITPSTPV